MAAHDPFGRVAQCDRVGCQHRIPGISVGSPHHPALDEDDKLLMIKAPDYLPLLVQRDWDSGALGPVEQCQSCWQNHPVSLDCQIYVIADWKGLANRRRIDDLERRSNE